MGHGTVLLGSAHHGTAQGRAWCTMAQQSMAQRGTAQHGTAQGTWSRLQEELAHCRETPMQKHLRQPSGLASLRWKVPAAHSSHCRPVTLGCKRGQGLGKQVLWGWGNWVLQGAGNLGARRTDKLGAVGGLENPGELDWVPQGCCGELGAGENELGAAEDRAGCCRDQPGCCGFGAGGHPPCSGTCHPLRPCLHVYHT